MSHSFVEGRSIVRKTSKRSRIILGAAVASALAGLTASSAQATDYSWVGTTGGPSLWDAAVNWNPNTGFPSSSLDNATFGNTANDFLVSLNNTSQSINNLTFTTTTSGYTIGSGSLTLTSITQALGGNNTISAHLIMGGPINVSAGTLSLTNTGASGNALGTVNVSGGATLSGKGGSSFGETNALGNATVRLDGGTLRADGILTGQNMLLASFYPDDTGDQREYLDPGVFTPGPTTLSTGPRGILTRTPAGQRELTGRLRFSDLPQPDFGDIREYSRGAITEQDNLSVLWTGKLNVSAADVGTWHFGSRSDDGSVVWIDLDNDGVFEYTGDPATNELILDNNEYQGPTPRTNNDTGAIRGGPNRGHPNLNLTAGSYNIAIGWSEGGWTGEVTAGFIRPSMGALDPNVEANYAIIEPRSSGQAGLWSFENTNNLTYDANYSTTNVTAAAGATANVDATSARSATFGNLSLEAGSTLNVTGNQTNFASTTAQGTVTINNSAPVNLGGIAAGGAGITRINKQGSGTASATGNIGASGLTSSSTVSVQAGMFAAMADSAGSALSGASGGATISLEGGTFRAQADSGGNALRARYYAGPNATSLIDPIENLMALSPQGSGMLIRNLQFHDDQANRPANFPDIMSESGGVLGVDNFSVLWNGRINIAEGQGGIYRFGTTSDDGSTIWIDLDHDGKFEYSSNPAENELIVNNNIYQGPTFRDNNNPTQFLGHSGHPNLTLNPGSYDIAIGWYEGGGGADMGAFIQGPATGGFEQVINPTAQAGLFTAANPAGTVANFSASAVNVVQDSKIDILAAGANFGALNISSGKVLTVTGVGFASFTSTTGSGALTINTDPDGVSADVLTGGIVGGVTGITKNGNASLFLNDPTNPSGLGAGSVVSINSGGLGATHSGTNNTLGAATVNMANGTRLSLSSHVAGTPVTYSNAVNAAGSLSVTGAAVVGNNRFGVDGGSVILSTLNAANNAAVDLAVANGYSLTIANTNLAGNASVNNSSSSTNISLGNVSGTPSSVLNVNGSNRTRVTGNVVANNVIINSQGVTFDPGTGNTSNSSTNIQVFTNMQAASGITDIGQGVISGNPAHFVAGLWEGRVTNVGEPDRNINKVAPNPNQQVTLNLRRINQTNVDTSGGPNAGWETDSTYIYTGQIFIPDNDVAGDGLGKISFGENFDDYTQIRIDGQLKMDDPGWNVPTTTGPLILSAGWHDIEFRGGQGVGGVGPVGATGWGGTKAVGIDMLGRGSNDGALHVEPADNGSMNLFRALIPVGGVVDIASGAELRVGGLTTLGAVNIDGNGAAKLTLNDHTTASNSDVVNLNVVNGGLGAEVQIGANTTLTATNLNIRDGNSLTKTGPGVLRVAGNLDNGNSININAGKLQLNGTASPTGSITVNAGGTLGGTGATGGAVTVNSGGAISPHDEVGIATLTISDSLTLNAGALLNFNFNGLADMVDVRNNLTLSGNSTLNINAITGFTTGTYPIIRMVNVTDFGDVVIGTNNGPAAFNYSILETPTEISLVVTAQQYEWRGTTNGSWEIGGPTNWVDGANVPRPYQDLVGVTFDDDGVGIRPNVVVAASGVAPSSILVNSSGNYSIGGGAIQGPTGLTKRGAGTLTLTGSNSFIGPVIIEGGTVDANSIANSGSNSALGAGATQITLGGASTAGTLRYSGATAGATDRGLILGLGGGTVNGGTAGVTFSGLVSGDGSLTKSGAGTVTLSGAANTNQGSLAVNQGTLSVNSMGAGLPGTGISLSSGGSLDYTGVSQTNNRGLTTVAGSGPVGVTAAASNLTLLGNVSGPTVTKSGPGTLTLAGTASLSGTTHVHGPNAGTLAFSGSGNSINGTYTVNSASTLRTAPGSLGSAAVTLNGGTLSLQDASTNLQGLNGEFYQFGPSQAILESIQAFDAALTANSTTLYATANTSLSESDPNPDHRGAINNIAGGGNPFSQYGVVPPGGNDNLVTRWTGKLNISAAQAGLTTFFTASDDGSVLWIDGIKVVDNNFFQGTTERQGQINLAEGSHDVVIGFYEGGGDASMVLRWIPVGGGKEPTPNSVFSSGTATYGTNVTAAAGQTSAIDVTRTATAALGSLSLGDGSTLRVTSGGTTFTGTTLGTAGGTYNLHSGWDTNLNQVSGSGTINKTGIGKMILETANQPGLGAGSIINVSDGIVAGVGETGMTNPFGAAAINLSNNGGILLSSRNGNVTMDTAVAGTGNVRIGAGPAGTGTAGAHVLTLGSAAKPVNLAAGATADLSAAGGNSLMLPAVQLAGDATLRNSSSNNVTVGNISGGAGNVSFTGTAQTRLTGNITGSNNVTVSAGALNVDPGASATSNIGAPVKVTTTLNVQSGTTNVGSNIVSGQTAVATAGLNEYFANGAFYEGPIVGRPNSYNVPDEVQLYPRRANQAAGNTNANPPGQGGNAPGWTDNSTYIYRGQILVPDNGAPLDGVGHFAIGMRFDDSVLLRIDGVQRMRDTNWDNSTSSGEIVLPAGWHDIEMRFGEGGGGVGPNSGASGWGVNFPDGTPAAVGVQFDTTIGFDANTGTQGATGSFSTFDKYRAPIDNGSMNLFRIAATPESGNVNVAGGATLNAGGLADIQILSLTGGTETAPAAVNLSAAHSGSVVSVRAEGDALEHNTLNLAAGNNLKANRLTVAAGTIFNKDGAGTLTVEAIPGAPLTAGHDFGAESVVNVKAGKLMVNTAVNAGGTGGVIVYSGATFGGSGAIPGSVAVDPDGRLAPGNGIGTLTVGGLTLDGSVIEQEGGLAGLDKIVVASDGTSDVFTLSGMSTFNLIDLGSVTAGDYVVIDYNNSAPLANPLANLTVTGNYGGQAATLSHNTENQTIVMTVGGPGQLEAQWNVDFNGSWGVATNWQPNVVPNGDTFIARLLGVITAPRTITLDGDRTVGTLVFNNANKYTVAQGTSGTLTLGSNTAAGLLDVNVGGSHEISAPVALAGNTGINTGGDLTLSGGLSIAAGKAANKTGAGVLTLSGAQNHGAGSSLTVSAGTLKLNSSAGGAGAAGATLALSVGGGGGRVDLGADQNLKSLSVAFADAGTQTFDLASPVAAGEFNGVTIYAADLDAAKLSLWDAIVNANQQGAINPLDGIVDSGLHASSGVGIARMTDHVMIRATRTGDLNLDGTVTIADFIDLASNFNTIGTATWQEGDLNYDRNVTIADFIDLASNFNSSYAGSLGEISSEDHQLLANFATSIGVDPSIIGSAVPEPGTLSVLAIGGLGLLSRRRRQRSLVGKA